MSLSLPSLGRGIVYAAELAMCAFVVLKLVRMQSKKEKAKKKHERKMLKLYTPLSSFHPTLPRSMLSGSLSHLQLGSDACRELFFLQHDIRGKKLYFLNHGSYGAVPRSVFSYYFQLLMMVESHPDLWFRTCSYQLTRQALDEFARVLNTRSQDLVFVNNATSGVNAVLNSLQLHANSIIVTPDCTYRACKLAMEKRARDAGCLYVEFPIQLPVHTSAELVGQISHHLDVLAAANPNHTIAFGLFDMITSPSAIVMPYAQIAKLCKSRNILCMLDGAHAIGQIPIDFTTFSCDYWTSNLHKWLYAPKGCALLYCAPALQATLHPVVTSHNTHEDYNKRFWMQATRDDAAYISAVESLKFMEALNTERVQDYCKELNHHAAELLYDKFRYSDVNTSFLCSNSLSAPNMRCVALPFPVPHNAARAHALADQLMAYFHEEYYIVVPIIYEKHTNKFYVRISSNIYNQAGDYLYLAECVLKYSRNPVLDHQ